MAHPNVHLARYIDIPTFLCYVLQTLQQLEYCTFLIIDGHVWSARWIGHWGEEQSWPQSVRIHCFYTINGEFFGTVSLLRFLEWYQLGTCFPSFTNLAAKAVLWWGGALHSTIHGGTELSILTNFVIWGCLDGCWCYNIQFGACSLDLWRPSLIWMDRFLWYQHFWCTIIILAYWMILETVGMMYGFNSGNDVKF